MLKAIKSMTNVKVLSKKEIQTIRGGQGGCSETRPCADGWCCNLLNSTCERGGPYGGCYNP